MAATGMMQAPWGMMPADMGLGQNSGMEFMLIPQAALPQGTIGSLEKTVGDATAKVEAKPAERKKAPAYTPEQLAMLQRMILPQLDQGRVGGGGGGGGFGHGPTNLKMEQLGTSPVRERPTLASLLYGRR